MKAKARHPPQAIIPLRQKSATTRVFIIDGVAQ
jgi:hypothetical protein